jgi:hypothetical protein
MQSKSSIIFLLIALIVEKWPELGEDGLNIQVTRYGSCNTGWVFNVKSTEHGLMKQFSVTGTVNGRVKNPVVEAELISMAGVITEIMPGSVMATRHELPQIVINANGQRSACDTSDQNCNFEFLENMTPEIISVKYTDSGAVATEIAYNQELDVEINLKEYSGSIGRVTF